MNLLILLSVIATVCSDKLDRTYLPPPNAGTAGGSPGALTAPGPDFRQGSSQQTGQVFGQQPVQQDAGQSSRPFGQQTQQRPEQVSSFNVEPNNITPSAGFGQPNSLYGSPNGRPSTVNSGSGSAPAGPGFNQPLGGSGQNLGQVSYNNFGSQPSAYNQASQSGFSNQPERPQAAADKNAEILKYINENDGDRFTYSFETTNGISAEESGVAAGGVKAQGGYSYIGDDGKSYTITYTADEQGFVPQGEHLPTPHPIPEEILKSIEKNAQAAAAGTQEGAYRPEEYESDDDVQGYNSAGNFVNRPQGPGIANQQLSASSGTPTNAGFGNQQTSGILSRPSRISDSLNQPFNQGSVQVNSGRPQSGFNSQVQGQYQSDSGYDYNQPQSARPQFSNTQVPGNQNRPDVSPFNTGSITANAPSRPTSPFNIPSSNAANQDQTYETPQQGPSGVQTQLPNSRKPYQSNLATSAQSRPSQTGNIPNSVNQYQQSTSNQYPNRPVTSSSQNSPSQEGTSRPGSGSFNTPNRPSQYQPVKAASPQGSIGFGVKGSTPIQAPYQYDRPSQPFSQNQDSSQSLNRPIQGQSAQRPSQPTYQPSQNQRPSQPGYNRQSQNQPAYQSGSSRPGYNQPTQGFIGQSGQGQGPLQSQYNQPSQSQRPQAAYNQASQSQPSQTGFKQPTQNQGLSQPGFGQQSLAQRPSSPGYNRPSENQRPAQPAYNQQGNQRPQPEYRPSPNQGSRPEQARPSQTGYNQPSQGQPAYNRPGFGSASNQVGPQKPINRPEEFGGPRQPPSFNPQDGYTY